MADAHPEGFDHLLIRDPLLLSFWQQASLQTSGDGVEFKTFTNVLRLFVNLRQSLEQVAGLRELNNPQRIGSDREMGEIDPGQLQQLLETVEEQPHPLSELKSPPAHHIKFLNRQEQSAAELLAELGQTAQALPLSLLRCEVFEPGRKRLTQALRDKASPEKRRALIEQCAEQNYLECITGYHRLNAHIEQVLLASLYVLLRNRSDHAPAWPSPFA